MAVQSDFMLAINQIAAERGIDVDEVLDAVKAAVLTGFKKDYPQEEEEEGMNLKVEIDKDLGKFFVFADKKVVKQVTNEATQISLDDAKKIEAKLKVGDHIEVDVTPTGDFGRVVAQVAKQVILQKLRESEKEAVMEEFKDKMGQIETGVIQRMDGDAVIVEVRRASAVMEVIPFWKNGVSIISLVVSLFSAAIIGFMIYYFFPQLPKEMPLFYDHATNRWLLYSKSIYLILPILYSAILAILWRIIYSVFFFDKRLALVVTWSTLLLSFLGILGVAQILSLILL